MEPDELEDDLGLFYFPPTNAPATTDRERSQRLGQQRADFNISPPTIPRRDTANIFFGGAFTSTLATGQFQPSASRLRPLSTQLPPHGHIPSYYQEGDLSSNQMGNQVDRSTNLRWQSRLVPQAQHQGIGQHHFTPLHNASNEESKLPSMLNQNSPVGVTSPGFMNLASPLYQRPTQVPAPTFSPPPQPVPISNASTHRPVSATTINDSVSNESLDSLTRGRQRKNRKNVTQRKLRTPRSQDTPTHESSSKSPPPQNLRGDPFRSAKVKTELCRHYNTPKGCPFGDKCNYAHGEHELKYTKLMDLERAGLVDIEIFRTHPCPTWVATGACPFDQRCIGLHDPRVEGFPSNPAWLPHAETLINKVGTGKNVDKFFHERLASIYNSCPIYGFIPKHDPNSALNEGESVWRQFHDFICNKISKQVELTFDPNKHVLKDLSEEHKLEIVLKMRGNNLSQAYAYIPTHLFWGDLCMILQQRTFQIVSILDATKNTFSTVLEEVTADYLVPIGALQFKAYEIAFGPVGDPTVRPPSIWFDIPKDDLTPCTPQQAKHHKRSRHRIKKTVHRLSPHLQGDLQTTEKYKSIRIPPFYTYQPLDHVAFDLITSVLLHRLKMVKLLSGKFDDSLHEVGSLLEAERINLKQKFLCLLRFWVICSWPEEALQEPIHDETDVPSVMGKYTCLFDAAKFFRSKDSYGLGSDRHTYNLSLNCKLFPSILWKSFTVNMLILQGRDIEYIHHETLTRYDNYFNQIRRLPILRHLSMGGRIVKNRFLPHIRPSGSVGPSSLSQCIEDLFGEWEDLKTHYIESGNSSSPLRRSSSSQTPTKSQTQQAGSHRSAIESMTTSDNVNAALEHRLKAATEMRNRISF